MEIHKGSGTESDPCKVGCLQDKNASVVRIVHISDTHTRHMEYLPVIPKGDILVHSGDFNKYGLKKRINTRAEFDKDINDLNNFFGLLPHKHKIFVAGNHEITFEKQGKSKIKSLLTNGVYLEAESIILEGIKIYGAPWNNWRWWAFSRAFALKEEQLEEKWQEIPHDTDILVTHDCPHLIMDTGRKKPWMSNESCACAESPHHNVLHWGSKHLKQKVLDLKIPLHLFGHHHFCNGVLQVGDTLFSNAAMDLIPHPKVIDFYLPNTGET